jgi:hypothetical protein
MFRHAATLLHTPFIAAGGALFATLCSDLGLTASPE